MSTIKRQDVSDIVVRYLVRSVDDLDPATLDTSQSMVDLGATSLDIVEVVSCSMRELRLKIPRKELQDLQNIDQLVDLLHGAVERKAAEMAETAAVAAG